MEKFNISGTSLEISKAGSRLNVIANRGDSHVELLLPKSDAAALLRNAGIFLPMLLGTKVAGDVKPVTRAIEDILKTL